MYDWSSRTYRTMCAMSWGRSGVTNMVGADAYFDDSSEVLERFQTNTVRDHDDGSTPSG